MKRVLLLTLTLLFIFTTMTSCIVIPRYKNFEIDSDTVASIEIYDLCEVDTLYGDFVETETSVYEIPPEKSSGFLNDLAEIQFSDPIIIVLAAIDPSFIMMSGLCELTMMTAPMSSFPQMVSDNPSTKTAR